MNPMLPSYQQGAETHNFVNGLSKPRFRLVIMACIFVNGGNKRTRINVGIADSTHKNSWWTSSIQISALEKRNRLEVRAEPNNKRAPCFAAKELASFTGYA